MARGRALDVGRLADNAELLRRPMEHSKRIAASVPEHGTLPPKQPHQLANFSLWCEEHL
jgi:hypothetical protein